MMWTSRMPNVNRSLTALGAILVLALSAQAWAELPTVGEGLMLDRVSMIGRSAMVTDPVAAMVAAGTWQAPQEGDTLDRRDGEKATWTKVEADFEGWFRGEGLAGRYLYVPVKSDRAQPALLHTVGSETVYINGRPLAGDYYGFGYLRIPIHLKKGDNEILVYGGRSAGFRGNGRLRVALEEVPASLLQIDTSDMTTPDLIVGETADTVGAVKILSWHDEARRDLTLRLHGSGLKTTVTKVPVISPVTLRKVGFEIDADAPTQTGDIEATLDLFEGNSAKPIDSVTFRLRRRAANQTYKRTFVSEIDGSVQYYAVNPADALPGDDSPKAIFLSVHGASVEATNQANAYSSKSWGHLICPTNRRPYGFAWEEWGLIDGMEVLADAKRIYNYDKERIYLTGHSMGGHGSWMLSQSYPDQFAATAPCAGYGSLRGYASRFEGGEEEEGEMSDLFQRLYNQHDGPLMAENNIGQAVYIFHGDADPTVPVSEARKMRDRLEELGHRDFVHYEHPGAGHWWDASDEPGASCVDWPAMFDLFARRTLPPADAVRQVDFMTCEPGISAWRNWAGILAQRKQIEPSRVSLRHDPYKRRFVGTTENVARLAIKLDHVSPGGALTVDIDGAVIEDIAYPEGEKKIWLERVEDEWKVIDRPSPAEKGPHRSGPFKAALNDRVVFVYGTAGTAEENAWALGKATFDAQEFYYRGNASIEVIADADFDAAVYPDRGVVLYGNADTNSAWSGLLGESPVQVTRSSVRVGERKVEGEDLACMFVRPRADSDKAMVAAISGTGLKGLRLNDRLPIHTSGARYPDVTVLEPTAYLSGMNGVVAAGYFGIDWSIDEGEFVWR